MPPRPVLVGLVRTGLGQLSAHILAVDNSGLARELSRVLFADIAAEIIATLGAVVHSQYIFFANLASAKHC